MPAWNGPPDGGYTAPLADADGRISAVLGFLDRVPAGA
jgi:hypothetical protein